MQQDLIPPRNNGDNAPWGGGRLVYLTPAGAGRGYTQTLRVTLPIIRPKEIEVFVLFVHARNSGMFPIVWVGNLSLRTVIFDDEDKTVSKAFQALQWVDFFSSQSLSGLGNQNQVYANVVARLESNNFRVDSKSARVLEEISQWIVREQNWEGAERVGDDV